MAEECANCGSAIVDGGIIKLPNQRFKPVTVDIVNFVQHSDYPELCEKCGRAIVDETFATIDAQIDEQQRYIYSSIVDFPMMTVAFLPSQAEYTIKTMLTANVTVGTGIFNELSQGFSDLFGAVNTETGMAHKVNSGEAAARSILVRKAMAIKANAIIGVDIDYGVTGNNAATVNMQGTAVLISNLDEVLDQDEFSKAKKIWDAHARIGQLQGWRQGDLQPSTA
jgi:uncharacterized protein YbjQ (UPF0145 family)